MRIFGIFILYKRGLKFLGFGLLGIALIAPVITEASKHHKKSHLTKATVSATHATLWRSPGNIGNRDLFYGPGGREHSPREPFTFVEEDTEQSSPKFEVTDGNGVKWKVKLGREARPETAATRFVWAAGYFVDEDYYLPSVRIEGLTKLRRGNKFVSSGGIVRGARFERKIEGQKNLGDWSWFDNPFRGTREFNGLKVMMALINNWDLKTINNHIYQEKSGEVRYAVADLGATFGKTGNAFVRSDGVSKDYENSKLIKRTKDSDVDFVMHSRPLFFFAPYIPYYRNRTRMESIVKDIPAADAKWIGQLLSGLSRRQIEDVFRASGYDAKDVNVYTNQFEKRIHELASIQARY